MTARELRIGFAPVLALRVTYLGELGWELHLPAEYAAHVYELLWAAGRDLGLADAGYRAIDSLRLEKRYLYWGSDITPDYTPYEAGLGFAVSLKKKSDFIGRGALEKAKAAGPSRELITLLIDTDVQLYGGEAIRRNGKVLGVTSSAGWGHTIGKAVAFGYVPAEEAGHADYEIEASPAATPPLHDGAVDPQRKKILVKHAPALGTTENRYFDSARPRRSASAGTCSRPAGGQPVIDCATRARQRFSSAWPWPSLEPQDARARSADFDGAHFLEIVHDHCCGLRHRKESCQVGAGDAGRPRSW
jgi:hypothetical protein